MPKDHYAKCFVVLVSAVAVVVDCLVCLFSLLVIVFFIRLFLNLARASGFCAAVSIDKLAGKSSYLRDCLQTSKIVSYTKTCT